jgi:predicted RNA binding protein YcfA (HicA-like mRNA interferase family)
VTVREVVAKLMADGWYQVRQKGSHQQFAHPTKPGRVTVPTHRGDLKPGTLHSIFKQAGWK